MIIEKPGSAYNPNIVLHLLSHITPYVQGLWIAIGPLLGVFIGAMLARSWDKKRAKTENRMIECRELLAALSDSFTTMLDLYAAMRPQSLEEQKQLADAEARLFRTVRDRMFIAFEIRELDIESLWIEALRDYKASFDAEKLVKSYDRICRDIVKLGTRL